MPGRHPACHTPSLGLRLQGQSHRHPQAQENGPIAWWGEGRAGDTGASQPNRASRNCGEVTSVME